MEHILDIDRNGINQIGEWVTNKGYFDMQAKAVNFSSREFIRGQHVEAAKDASDNTTQEWIDKRQEICKAGLHAHTVAGFNMLQTDIVEINDRIPALHKQFWDDAAIASNLETCCKG